MREVVLSEEASRGGCACPRRVPRRIQAGSVAIGDRVSRFILRDRPLTDGEWHVLLEERRQLIRPRLKALATDFLGQAQYLSSGLSFTLADYVDSLPECQNDDLLGTRGIFGPTRLRDRAADCRRLHAFGLTADDRWMLYGLALDDSGNGVLTAAPLCMPEDFSRLQLSYRNLFVLLGRSVEGWLRRCESRLERAQVLRDRLVREDGLIALLQAATEED